jgi:hypothetical protein
MGMERRSGNASYIFEAESVTEMAAKIAVLSLQYNFLQSAFCFLRLRGLFCVTCPISSLRARTGGFMMLIWIFGELLAECWTLDSGFFLPGLLHFVE